MFDVCVCIDCAIPGFNGSGILGLVITPVIKLVASVESRIDPMMAEPSDAPSWRKVPLTPEASPACVMGTAERVMLFACDMISPMPMPKSMNPGVSAHAEV